MYFLKWCGFPERSMSVFINQYYTFYPKLFRTLTVSTNCVNEHKNTHLKANNKTVNKTNTPGMFHTDIFTRKEVYQRELTAIENIL